MKKKHAFVMGLALLLIFLLCCPVFTHVSAVGERITLMNMRHGKLYSDWSDSFQFHVPALSNVTIYFTTDFNDEAFVEYGTIGDAIIQVKDSNNKTILKEEKGFEWLTESYKLTLTEGDYVLTLTHNEHVNEPSDYYYPLDSIYDEKAFINDHLEYCFEIYATLLEDIQPSSLTLNKTKVSVSVGDKTQLIGTYTPANATVDPIWTSSNTKVATVNADGEVTAKAMGSAIITLKMGIKTVSCVVNVTRNDNAVRVFAGKRASVQRFFSNIAGIENATWTSSDRSIARVNNDGLVSGKAVGTARITVTVKGVKYSQAIRVATPSVTLNKSNATIYVGKAAPLYKGGTISLNATTDPANRKVTWKSSDKAVAKVSKTGKVTAVAAGTATITASFKQEGKVYSKSCKVTVKKKAGITVKYVDWTVNSADGVEPCVTFINNTTEVIKYINFTTQYYNAVGDVLYNDIDGERFINLKVTGPFKPGKKRTFYWDTVFYSGEGVHAIQLNSIKITYMDGKTENVKYNMLWMDRYYYQG